MLHSDLPITRLGPQDRPCLHSYYDICPEDPASGRVLATMFCSDHVPGPAQVAVLEPDGSLASTIGVPHPAIGHVGRFALWLDADRIAYRDAGGETDGGWLIHHLTTGRSQHRPGSLRQWHRGRQRGLVQTAGPGPNPHHLTQGAAVVDEDGAVMATIEVAACAAVCPAEARLPANLDEVNIMNLKWSPDGTSFSLVLTDELFRSRLPPGHGRYPCKGLVVVDADGGRLRWIGSFTHHPVWTADSRQLVAMCANDHGGQDLVALPADGSGAKRVLGRDIPGIHGHLLDNARLLIDVPIGEPPDRCGIVLIDLVDGQRTELVNFDHLRWHHRDGHHPHPVPSADLGHCYFNAAADGRCGLYRVRLP